MSNVNRLNKMYEYAIENSLCKNKKEFASLIGVYPSNLSKAFGGESGFMTDKFLLRVNEALGNVFLMEWVLYGTGEMYAARISPVSPDTTPSPSSPVTESSSLTDRHVKNLEDLVETLQAFNKVLQKDNARLERENEALKKGSVLAKNA